MAPGPGPQPGAGNFSPKTGRRPGPRGDMPRAPRRGRESAKLLSERGTDLMPRGFCGCLSPAPLVWPSGSPAPSHGFKPPARTRVHAAASGPRAALEEVQLSPRPRVPAPGSAWPRDDLAVRAAAPARALGDGRLPGGSGRGRPSSREGRAASQTLPSCHRPLAAAGRPPAPRPLPRRRADAGALPRRRFPRVAAVCPGSRLPAQVRVPRWPRLLTAGQMGRASCGLEL